MERKHLPALDGLRAIAVAGVLAYHLGLGWASGGYLGVDLFFVLSGFLITTLLLEEWVRSGTISLASFWARRARRLLPALFAVLIAIALFVVVDGRYGSAGGGALVDLSGLRGDALATLLYVANWHAIFAHQSYFAQFSAPSPLEHTWSLAIEEQFYLVWPIMVLGLVTVFARSWRRLLFGVSVGAAALSAVLMAVLYHEGSDPTRVYFGTDTRAFALLIGAALAIAVVGKGDAGARARRLLHLLAVGAAIALGVVWGFAGSGDGEPASWMFRGGFLLAALLGAAVLADVRQQHQGPLSRLLSLAPLQWLGRISYGVYLWHWPVFVYLNASRTGWHGAGLDFARLGVTFALSIVSYVALEQPVRRGFRTVRALRTGFGAAAVTAGAVLVATIPAVAAPAGAVPQLKLAPASAVPGAGGYRTEVPIALASPPTHANPLRIMLIGDSVMKVAAPAITEALGATEQSTVADRTIDGFGLSTAKNWRSAIPTLIAQVHPQLIVATWSWDDSWALQDPSGYRVTLEQAIGLMLTPGNGVAGVVFTQFPPSGEVIETVSGNQATDTAARTKAQNAWAAIVATLPRSFPGRVMYLPLASSVLLHGRFSSWLPPPGQPGAPASQWDRVRMVDNVHLCPAGAARYADALLSDLQSLYRLGPARRGWQNGAWVDDPRYNTPPGSCPDDHPA